MNLDSGRTPVQTDTLDETPSVWGCVSYSLSGPASCHVETLVCVFKTVRYYSLIGRVLELR